MHDAPATVAVGGRKLAAHAFNTIVVGSGAAALNAAEYLHRHGQRSVAVVTEGIKKGTSRNTGSDKQTYYKLTLCGDEGDSVGRMADTLFAGQAVDGDLALAEAAGSAQCFYRLVDLGVPFPRNAFGEYVGYKTDHDPLKRGISCGPLTSKYMTECLLRAVRERDIPIFDHHQVVEILTLPDGGGKKAAGVLALNLEAKGGDDRYVLFAATNVVYATGGEAGMYEMSVYPHSQNGATGAAFRAGVRGKNLTESQYGITSVKFRWNLSGSYQQVLPRYISTDSDGGDVTEFLDRYFADTTRMLTAIFLKGYQWPFDPRKIPDGGSSLIDILVYNEIMNKGRRVWLDYRANPSRSEVNGALQLDLLAPEPRDYLANSGALLDTPFKRLAAMNPAAVELYRSHGINLETELLEIAVSNQHNNGGLAADHWWHSEITGFFPVGEVNGSHGVYRPGGSALNAGQVGSMRAAGFIAARRKDAPPPPEAVASGCAAQLEQAIGFGEKALTGGGRPIDIAAERQALRRRMSRFAAHIRSAEGTASAMAEARDQLAALRAPAAIPGPEHLGEWHQLLDLAVCQYVYLFAVHDYIAKGGASRGSYLVHDASGEKPHPALPDVFRFRLDDGALGGQIQEVSFDGENCAAQWRPVRPLPQRDGWFETVWAKYVAGEIYGE